MKTILLVAAFVLTTIAAKADQLAYVSKADAERAAAFIRTQKSIFVYCGCCKDQAPEKIKVKRVEVRAVDGGAYYEVVVFDKKNGGSARPLDLAYAWIKEYNKKYLTVAAFLGLSHDPCGQFPGSWT